MASKKALFSLKAGVAHRNGEGDKVGANREWIKVMDCEENDCELRSEWSASASESVESIKKLIQSLKNINSIPITILSH